MRGWIAAAFTIAAMSGSGPAHACFTRVPPVMADVRYASVVVIGRVANYRIVLDQEVRRKRREMLAHSPNMPASMRRDYANQKHFLSDFARFDVVVDEVLTGAPPRIIPVTWNNSTFGEPETMAPGPYLIALRDPAAALPPLRGPSGFIPPNPDSSTLTLLQAPCSSPFLFSVASEEAGAVRRLVDGQ